MHTEQPLPAMDISEATKIVMSRVRNLDIENATRIMGYILIQDRGEQDMIMLALGPDALLVSYVNQAKAQFALNSSNLPSDANIFPQSTPRILIPNNGFHYSNPSSPANFSAVLNDFDSQFYGGDELLCGGFEDAASGPPPHRRSHSVNDVMIMSHLEEGGSFEKRPCSYYARGYCKNGNACKFLHVDNVSDETIEAIQNQRFSHMASRNHRPSSSSSAYSKSINFLNENSRRGPRNERSPTGLEAALTSRSRQIYLTFPHESTFREEDVCSYFSKFGPVQDVRIPHQDKRMFGFVTFAYPETVKRILAKGNPHFVCDSRVLVKPYKDKGKFADKKHQIWDSPEAFDPPIGSRMLSTQDMIFMRNLEQKAELQHSLELQTRRMMDLRLMDHRFQPHLPVGVPVFSPRGSSELLKGENGIASYDADFRDVFQEFDSSQETADDESSLEHILPENLFTCEDHSGFYNAETEDDNRPFGRVSPR